MQVRSSGDLAATIRGRRLELGLSQASLADRAGVSRKWLWDIERGKPSAAFGLLLRVLDALSLALDIAPLDRGTAPGVPEAVDLDALLTEHRGPGTTARQRGSLESHPDTADD